MFVNMIYNMKTANHKGWESKGGIVMVDVVKMDLNKKQNESTGCGVCENKSKIIASDTNERKKINTALRVLAEYNIEVKITERKTSKKVFIWRKGNGNLHKGIVHTNEFMLQKLGCDIEDIVKEIK